MVSALRRASWMSAAFWKWGGKQPILNCCLRGSSAANTFNKNKSPTAKWSIEVFLVHFTISWHTSLNVIGQLEAMKCYRELQKYVLSRSCCSFSEININVLLQSASSCYTVFPTQCLTVFSASCYCLLATYPAIKLTFDCSRVTLLGFSQLLCSVLALHRVKHLCLAGSSSLTHTSMACCEVINLIHTSYKLKMFLPVCSTWTVPLFFFSPPRLVWTCNMSQDLLTDCQIAERLKLLHICASVCDLCASLTSEFEYLLFMGVFVFEECRLETET